MLLMIDNYDSFTFNLVHYFKGSLDPALKHRDCASSSVQALNEDVRVYRNDQITIAEIEKLQPKYIVLSPGPGRPEDAGITVDCIRHFAGKIPILGVCLGHQAIGQAFGASIINAKKIMHGKTSSISHNNNGVFKNITNPFLATRYHSLVIDKKTLSDEFIVTAWTEDDEIMGIKHREFALEGVQFHPEGILTEQGMQLLRNFLTRTLPGALL